VSEVESNAIWWDQGDLEREQWMSDTWINLSQIILLVTSELSLGRRLFKFSLVWFCVGDCCGAIFEVLLSNAY
jgi:hypothetical protein